MEIRLLLHKLLWRGLNWGALLHSRKLGRLLVSSSAWYFVLRLMWRFNCRVGSAGAAFGKWQNSREKVTRTTADGEMVNRFPNDTVADVTFIRQAS